MATEKKAAEERAMNRAAQKTGNAVDNTVDKAAEQGGNMMGFGKNKIDASAVPDSYSFSWKYVMEINVDQKAVNVDYFLEPNASYFGTNIKQGGQGMLMIMDTKNDISISCFNNGNEKMAMASKVQDNSAAVKKEAEKSKFTYKTLPNKTFLGYNCKGIQATNDESDIIFYYTTEAKVSFNDIFKNQKNWKMPDALSGYLKPGEKSLLMDMSIKDLKNGGKVTKMKCTSLNKNAYVFNKADYKFM